MPSYSRTVQIAGKSAQEIYQKVSDDIDRFLSKTGMGKFEIEREEGAKKVNIKSNMFNGTLICREGSIEVDAKLSFLAAPFKGKLDEGIDKWLAKAFNT